MLRTALRPIVHGEKCPEAHRVLRAFTEPARGRRKRTVDRAVRSLKTAGLWDKSDVIWAVGADSQASLIDWKTGATKPANSGATFTADLGFTGNGTSAYIDSNFNPATAGGKYSQDSCTLVGWKNESAQDSKRFMGEGSVSHIWPRYTDDLVYYRMNGSADATAASTDGSGLWAMARTGSAAHRVDRNGVTVQSGTNASSAPASANLNWLYGGDYTAGTVRLGMILGGTVIDETRALYDIWAAYLAGL